MKKALLLFVICLVWGGAFAQNDLLPGYIISNGDTITGFLQQKNIIKSGISASFAPSPETGLTTYLPNDIQGYGFEKGDRFESKKLIWKDSVQSIFLNVLVKGKASLYSHRDNYGKDHYYLIKSDTLQELRINKIKQTQPSIGEVTVLDKEYRRILNKAFLGCPDLLPTINYVNLNRRDLKKVVVQYNQCAHPAEPLFVQEQEKPKLYFGVVAGSHHSTFALLRTPSSYMNNRNLPGGTNIVAGVTVGLPLTLVGRNTFLQTDVLYTQHQYTDALEHNLGGKYEMEIQLKALKLPLYFKQEFSTGNFKPFINLGVQNALNLSSSNHYIHTSTQESKEPQEFQLLSGERRIYMFGVMAGTGVSQRINGHKFSFEARFNSLNGIDDSNSGMTAIKNLSFLLSYSF
ncbi:outer membrane beta-barrel protein [Rufibacter roseus]|uniref:Outer membrane beta-barrel protein n=1 Tax=Rufibacter roseus TaxID=1567108 RepID=A0ABW2DLN4_9BACT|nr:outer membrane beta-barrel protein [Rufibacter roseus]